MCRFCACQLSKPELSKQCAYKKNNVEHEVPWNTGYNFVDYHPSNNLQPKDSGLPVIVDGKHLQSTESQLFCPMYWSLIPPWHKNDLKEWKATTHNARVENLNESKIYSASLNEGKRCIVVMEGFYEFKKTGSQPAEIYYLHSPENNLLKAAGLFSTLQKEKGKEIFTCTVLTTESENSVREIHHRVPLFLQDAADIEAWLDYKSVSSTDAVTKIKNKTQKKLKFYKTDKIGSKEPASTKYVNDSFYRKNLGSKNMMSAWLKTGTKRKSDQLEK